ncbi:substrate-binding domain-containing protein [Streptomyces solicathayae]|uniref:Substrate-binding domain-containing protein n=1 Tax=Streptomyces solicathayae TaxID=3081768 RepID=A0ABZ0M1G6_9ACTN|nr:substrate-binding domain-containing protein [Streptomyces sp. HUAS YS2]WOX25615.1 substrate-binding domain-containing protein [Streptomyces sp. HUAS YS2]
MGRHSLPDDRPARAAGAAGAGATGQTGGTGGGDGAGGGRLRRRTVALATVLVLAVAGGVGLAARNGLLSTGPDCDDAGGRLDVVASPDIAPALREIADDLRAQRVTSDGNCLDVRVTARENSVVATSLATARNTPDFDVWIADSSVWTERAKGSGDGVPLLSAGGVASSPVTLATAPAAARTLGWPSRTHSWAQLAALAGEPGKLRLGSADPARSATGLLALAGISVSTRGPESDTRIAATAKALSARTSDTDGAVPRTLALDPADASRADRNDAVFLSEQAAFTHNRKTSDDKDLRLLYPSDGVPRLDYPYHLVDERRQSTDQSRAAVRFMGLLGNRDALDVLQKHGFRTADAPAAATDSLVRTAGGQAPQPYAQASAGPAGRPSSELIAQTLGMWTITVQSARLTTVVDASGSMAAPVPGRDGQSRMDVTKASLIQALRQFTAEDEVGLWDFATTLDGDRDYRRLVPTAELGSPVRGGTTHRARLNAAFARLAPVPGGATGLYDTTLAAWQEAQKGYVPGKFNAVVILTDGSNQDQASIGRAALISRLQALADPQRPVPLIAIAVGPDADRDDIHEIARTTGGAGYQVSDPAEIQVVILKAIMTAGDTARAAANAP